MTFAEPVYRSATAADVPQMAALAQQAGLSLTEEHLTTALQSANTWWWVARAGTDLRGGMLARAAHDELEIYDVVVHASHRRQHVASHLLMLMVLLAEQQGITRVVLEVAADNGAARAFYADRDFVQVGLRPAYYPRVVGPAADAIIMALDLA